MKPILEIKGLGKKFKIDRERQAYLSLRDSISGIFKKGKTKEDFWALKDVSIDIMPGETIGIIGKNGAGKSTLLKILSKITPPTSGKITGRGRIASLLEVGTGFHPELTGRENIYMNGSILGMKRSEITRNFDAIIEFSGVEKFIDTPLKHYSSGMQLRLAFAVAAFLENEILIIDEVLAVGDAEFQKKCLGKMDDIGKNGRTLLFVSHDLRAISGLCKTGMCLEQGQKKISGPIADVTDYYLSNIFNSAPQYIIKSEQIELIKFRILNGNGEEVNELTSHNKYIFEMTVDAQQVIPEFTFAVCVNNQYNNRITSLWSAFNNNKYTLTPGISTLSIEANSLKLIPGVYELIIYFETKNIPLFRIDNYKTININYTNDFGITFIPTINQGYYVEDMKFDVNANSAL